MSVSNSVEISKYNTIFINLNAALKKLCLFLNSDKPLIDLIKAISDFQTLLEIRMVIISKLMPEEDVSACRTLKTEIDDILNNVKDLIVSGHKEDALITLNKIKAFKENKYIYYFRFEFLKEEASKQIETIDINTIKLLVSAAIYIQKIKIECNKFVEEDDDQTYNNIVELINNYYIVITERINLFKAIGTESYSFNQDRHNAYISRLKKIYDDVNLGASRIKVKEELDNFITSFLIPCSLSTKSMVKLIDGIVESKRDSIY